MIKQTVRLPVAPDVLYDVLMDEKKHSAFTNAKAVIDPKVGGKFSVWDGYAEGENLELIPGKKIVQTWKASDWVDDAVSKVTFTINPAKNGSELKFTHEDVPKEFEKDIEQGWKITIGSLLKNTFALFKSRLYNLFFYILK